MAWECRREGMREINNPHPLFFRTGIYVHFFTDPLQLATPGALRKIAQVWHDGTRNAQYVWANRSLFSVRLSLDS
jgi:hypothetical protein